MAGLATILGASGFVGSRLHARLAAEGREVFAPAKGDPKVLQRDLGTVFYCAGLTADYDKRPFDTVEAHATLLSEIIKVGRFERLVYLSSTRLYDSQTKTSVAETEPLLIDPSDPRRIYDLSKALGENLTVTRTGGRGVAARLANVYDWGTGAPGFLSEWLIRAASERDLRLDSSPNVVRDYIHLDDVVTALIELADKRATGIVNVASGELISNAEIADLFEQAGWKVNFTGVASAAPPPNVKIWRLEALGVRPRRVEDVVRGYLAELKA